MLGQQASVKLQNSQNPYSFSFYTSKMPVIFDMMESLESNNTVEKR